MPETPDLAAVARSHSVGIVGGGIGGLIVAWECAKVGMTVTLWEAGAVGGMTGAATLGDGSVNAFERSAAVDEVLAAFGLAGEVEHAATNARWLLQANPVPLPDSVALGVPANPFAADVTAIIGRGAVWRAYLDRLKPVLTIGNAEGLGELVRQRMGAKVTDRLVAPRTRAELHLDPDDVLIDVALPELNGALTRAGSLSGGVGLMDDAPAPVSLRGGLSVLTRALRARIEELGGTVHDNTPVTAVGAGDDGWSVTTATDAESIETNVRHLVLATGESAARDLLVQLLPNLPAPASTPQTVVTLAVTGPTATRGAGLYAADAANPVQRIDHVSAQWPATQRPAEHEIFRVTLAGHDDDAAAADRSRAAIADAYGQAVTVADAHVERFDRAQVRAARGFADRVAAVRAQTASLPHLDVAGAFVAGDSVSDVIVDAIATAEAIRRRALFPV